ncbi:MAG TPA: MarR family transcriptional regulator [Dinghuibacter sp.]|uniref:MarR family winged helix-turn-helix transcriptional regulator n=1 Tax=Dinghuibacter sp. TaxID=2024697 RepID=UPI002BE93149|nr:MarR family transcriptional regulator [Dinghuibacter sp.]HTJ10912.1 MarR family transcriptional regulator [Dinghuibacter sp.]
MALSDIELATGLRTQVSRLGKLLRRETRNDEQLSITERTTLSLIYDYGELLPGELAAMEKVTTQAMSQVLNRLLERGLIVRTTDEDDRRKVIVTLTDAGKKGVRQRLGEKEEWLTRTIAQKLNDREKKVLGEAIEVLIKLIG